MNRLIGALELISLASHKQIAIYDFKVIPKSWQDLMTQELRALGKIAEEALEEHWNKDSDIAKANGDDCKGYATQNLATTGHDRCAICMGIHPTEKCSISIAGNQ